MSFKISIKGVNMQLRNDIDKGRNEHEDLRNQSMNMTGSDLNEIIRGEMSAEEAYEQVLKKVGHDPEAYRLRKLLADHRSAVQYWKMQARLSGEVPMETSSLWGTVVMAFVGTSKILGEEAALRALKKGEEHGLSNYEKMLDSKELTVAEKNEIKHTFIPRQKCHIQDIEGMIDFH